MYTPAAAGQRYRAGRKSYKRPGDNEGEEGSRGHGDYAAGAKEVRVIGARKMTVPAILYHKGRQVRWDTVSRGTLKTGSHSVKDTMVTCILLSVLNIRPGSSGPEPLCRPGNRRERAGIRYSKCGYLPPGPKNQRCTRGPGFFRAGTQEGRIIPLKNLITPNLFR